MLTHSSKHYCHSIVTFARQTEVCLQRLSDGDKNMKYVPKDSDNP